VDIHRGIIRFAVRFDKVQGLRFFDKVQGDIKEIDNFQVCINRYSKSILSENFYKVLFDSLGFTRSKILKNCQSINSAQPDTCILELLLNLT